MKTVTILVASVAFLTAAGSAISAEVDTGQPPGVDGVACCPPAAHPGQACRDDDGGLKQYGSVTCPVCGSAGVSTGQCRWEWGRTICTYRCTAGHTWEEVQ